MRFCPHLPADPAKPDRAPTPWHRGADWQSAVDVRRFNAVGCGQCVGSHMPVTDRRSGWHASGQCQDGPDEREFIPKLLARPDRCMLLNSTTGRLVHKRRLVLHLTGICLKEINQMPTGTVPARIPTGFRLKARGCACGAAPGSRPPRTTTPTGLRPIGWRVVSGPQPRWG